jgi:hypothetical protein
MRRIAVVVAVAGVCLTGCASMEGGGGITTSDPCTAGACKVSVDVTSCVITPKPDPLPVKGENNIFWELNLMSQFYQFLDDKSVALKTTSSEFDQPEVQANGKKFKLHDKNTLAGENKYPYWIKVQRWIMFQGWTDCPPLDPVIINGH